MTTRREAEAAGNSSRDAWQEEMSDIRASIDALDDEIVALLARRQRQIERAAAVKPRLGIPARVPDRIDEVLERVAEASRREGLSDDLARSLWSALIEWAIAYEERLMGDGGPRGGRDGEAPSDA